MRDRMGKREGLKDEGRGKGGRKRDKVGEREKGKRGG